MVRILNLQRLALAEDANAASAEGVFDSTLSGSGCSCNNCSTFSQSFC